MIEEILSYNGLERDVDYDENTIDSIFEMIAYSEIDVVEFIKNLKILTLNELLDFNPRLTKKSKEEYLKYLEDDVYHDEIVADLILEHLRHTSNEVYYYVDDFYSMYYVYIGVKNGK